VVDPLPGALEAVDENIATKSSNDNPSPTEFWNWYLANLFSTREFRSDKVVFVGFHLQPGTHTLNYKVIVSSEGIFTLPPTKAYDANQPELFGLSAGGIFQTTTFTNLGEYAEKKDDYCIPWSNRKILVKDLPAWMKVSLSSDVSVSSNDEEENQFEDDFDDFDDSDDVSHVKSYNYLYFVFGIAALAIGTLSLLYAKYKNVNSLNNAGKYEVQNNEFDSDGFSESFSSESSDSK